MSADLICLGRRSVNVTSSPGLISASVLTRAPRIDRSYTTPRSQPVFRSQRRDSQWDREQTNGAGMRTRGCRRYRFNKEERCVICSIGIPLSRPYGTSERFIHKYISQIAPIESRDAAKNLSSNDVISLSDTMSLAIDLERHPAVFSTRQRNLCLATVISTKSWGHNRHIGLLSS